MINRAAASETFINICYTSSPNRPDPLRSDMGPLRAFGKQANLNTPIFSGEQYDQYPEENPLTKKVRIIRNRPTVICELMRINAHSNNAVLSSASLLTIGFANADDGKLPLRDQAIH